MRGGQDCLSESTPSGTWQDRILPTTAGLIQNHKGHPQGMPSGRANIIASQPDKAAMQRLRAALRPLRRCAMAMRSQPCRQWPWRGPRLSLWPAMPSILVSAASHPPAQQRS
jgi:hypothetical protein